jgi:hypothetical protein
MGRRDVRGAAVKVFLKSVRHAGSLHAANVTEGLNTAIYVMNIRVKGMTEKTMSILLSVIGMCEKTLKKPKMPDWLTINLN